MAFNVDPEFKPSTKRSPAQWICHWKKCWQNFWVTQGSIQPEVREGDGLQRNCWPSRHNKGNLLCPSNNIPVTENSSNRPQTAASWSLICLLSTRPEWVREAVLKGLMRSAFKFNHKKGPRRGLIATCCYVYRHIQSVISNLPTLPMWRNKAPVTTIKIHIQYFFIVWPYRPFHDIPTDENNARASTAVVLACTATGNPPLKSVPGCERREGPQVFYDYFKISNRKEINEKNSLFSQNQ